MDKFRHQNNNFFNRKIIVLHQTIYFQENSRWNQKIKARVWFSGGMKAKTRNPKNKGDKSHWKVLKPEKKSFKFMYKEGHIEVRYWLLSEPPNFRHLVRLPFSSKKPDFFPRSRELILLWRKIIANIDTNLLSKLRAKMCFSRFSK